jgi:hypothetical protein
MRQAQDVSELVGSGILDVKAVRAPDIARIEGPILMKEMSASTVTRSVMPQYVSVPRSIISEKHFVDAIPAERCVLVYRHTQLIFVFDCEFHTEAAYIAASHRPQHRGSGVDVRDGRPLHEAVRSVRRRGPLRTNPTNRTITLESQSIDASKSPLTHSRVRAKRPYQPALASAGGGHRQSETGAQNHVGGIKLQNA